jgi:hypothetical protein
MLMPPFLTPAAIAGVCANRKHFGIYIQSMAYAAQILLEGIPAKSRWLQFQMRAFIRHPVGRLLLVFQPAPLDPDKGQIVQYIAKLEILISS